MNNFLIKLRKNRKLELVDESQEMCISYLIKSENCLRSSKILLKESIYENSIIDSYYAMYNCVLALFFKCGIKCENHTGSIIILREIFKIPQLAKLLKQAKKSRIDSQYYVSESSKINYKDVEEAIKSTEKFSLQIKFIINSIKKSEIERIKRDISN